MPLTQEELTAKMQALALAQRPVAQPELEPVETSYRTYGLTFAKQVTNDAAQQNAQIAVQLGPRDATGLLIENSPDIKNKIWDGPEAYEMAGFEMYGYTVIEHPFAAAVQAYTGVSIVGMTRVQAAPFIALYMDYRAEQRLNPPQQEV